MGGVLRWTRREVRMQQRRMEASQRYVFEHVAAMSNKGSHPAEEPEGQCRPSLGDHPHWGYLPSVIGQGLTPRDLTASAPPAQPPPWAKGTPEAREDSTQRPGATGMGMTRMEQILARHHMPLLHLILTGFNSKCHHIYHLTKMREGREVQPTRLLCPWDGISQARTLVAISFSS